MSLSGQQTATHLVPLMRYRDVGVASEWLCAAFGFEPHFAAKAPDGAVFYAELKLGDSMIMLGPSGEPSPDDVLQDAAAAKTDANEQSCYVVLNDVDTHYGQAKRSGANITLDIKSDDTGGRGYSCRDLEGHVWNFGTYDPWRGQAGSTKPRRAAPQAKSIPGLNAAIALTLAVSVLSGWFVYGYVRGPGDGLILERLRETIVGPRQPADGMATGGIARPENDAAADDASAAVSRAQRAMASLKEELDQERRAKAAALEAASQAQADNERAQAKAESARAAALAAQASVQEAEAKADQAHEHATELAKAESAQAETARRETERAAAAAAETARVERTAAQLRADLEQQRAKADAKTPEPGGSLHELHEAQAARDKAVQAQADAEAQLSAERTTKESALKALADAGARIATLEVELKAAKAETARARARPSTNPATARKTKKDESKTWPYSEW